ncbi:MAG: hypothetical protein ACYDH9_13410 [Limisphaerales bacterium]
MIDRLDKHAAWWGAPGLCLCGLLLAGCGGKPAAPSAQTNKPPAKVSTTKVDTNAAPAQAEIPKSVFTDDLKQGIDPFFPKSTRRQPKNAANPKSGVAAQPQDPLAEITLNGILGTSRRRIATINNRPFETGEVGEITLTGGKRIQIKCLQIDATSVEIAVEGQPERKKKLNLRKEF